MVSGLINANPTVYERKERRVRSAPADADEYAVERIDAQEIFDHVRDIKDPEHPYSLEELKVVTEDAIDVDDEQSHVRVTFTPTVEHCSMATVIGLCIRVKLMRSLPSRYKLPMGTYKMSAPRACLVGIIAGLISLFLFLSRTIKLTLDRWDKAKVDIRLAPGSHATEAAVNKQLNDKERIAAALENPNLLDMVDDCLAPTYA